MAIKFRFPLVRDVWCPAFGHWKSVKVCRAQRYESCQGCGVLVEDRDRYGSRLFRIVESVHYPGSLYTPEFIVLGVAIHRAKKLRSAKDVSSVSDGAAMGQSFKRLTRKKKKHGSKRHRR